MHKSIWNRPQVRWLPSRHRSSLARAYALFKLLRADTTPAQIALGVDRYQSAEEQYLTAIWMGLTMVVYAFALGRSLMPGMPAVLLVAFLLVFGGLLVQAPMFLMAPLWRLFSGTRDRDNQRITSNAYFVILFLLSSYYASFRNWVEPVAWLFLVVLALNALTFVVLWLFRAKIRELEQQCAG